MEEEEEKDEGEEQKGGEATTNLSPTQHSNP